MLDESTKNISDDEISSLRHGIGSSLRNGTNPFDTEKTPPRTWYDTGHDMFFVLCLLGTVVLLIWPWIFFGIVWKMDGIPMAHSTAAENHPKDTLYFVTFISGIISFLIGKLFARAVTSFAQKYLVHKDVAILSMSFFITLKGHGLNPKFLKRNIPLFLVLLLYFGIFFAVNPGIVALLTPIHYTRSVILNGSELNFASNDPDCIDWFERNTIPNYCDWEIYNGLEYTKCRVENQLLDVLDSGRGHILSSLPGNNISLTYNQLGATSGLHFLGSIRGLLPIGPNGVPAFNFLDAPSTSAFPNTATTPYPSYNYTLNLQGITTNVTCAYEADSPVAFYPISPGVFQYNGSCPSGQEVLTNTTFFVLQSNNLLGFWACLTAPGENLYTLYFHGANYYATAIGNIACKVSLIQPSEYNLTFSGKQGIFTTKLISSGTPIPAASPELGRNLVNSLGSVVWESHSSAVSNLLAESIITLGVKSFGLPPYNQSEGYLRLYEAMIQGMFDYEVRSIFWISSPLILLIRPHTSA
jgi:hypothetical protein